MEKVGDKNMHVDMHPKNYSEHQMIRVSLSD